MQHGYFGQIARGCDTVHVTVLLLLDLLILVLSLPSCVDTVGDNMTKIANNEKLPICHSIVYHDSIYRKHVTWVLKFND